MSADMLGVQIYYMAVSWHAWSGGAYMSVDTLGAHIYYMAVGWHTCSRGHICKLTCMECAYIILLSAACLQRQSIYVG